MIFISYVFLSQMSRKYKIRTTLKSEVMFPHHYKYPELKMIKLFLKILIIIIIMIKIEIKIEIKIKI